MNSQRGLPQNHLVSLEGGEKASLTVLIYRLLLM
jgi:hypothetical protein